MQTNAATINQSVDKIEKEIRQQHQNVYVLISLIRAQGCWLF